MYYAIGIVFLLLGHFIGETFTDSFATCLSCPEVSAPQDCRHSVTCGAGEVCYTKDYIDSRGRRGYRLGCEDKPRCDLSRVAVLLGKRAVRSSGCFECCEGFECNSGLCQGTQSPHGVPQQPQTSTPQCNCPTTFCPAVSNAVMPHNCSRNAGCLDPFISFQDKCYLFVGWLDTWEGARAYCKKHGGDLVSINTQEEEQFLVKEIDKMGVVRWSLWTGGGYTFVLGKWEWLDRTFLHYTNWNSSQPIPPSSTTENHIVLNIPSNTGYEDGKWITNTTGEHSSICEKKISL